MAVPRFYRKFTTLVLALTFALPVFAEEPPVTPDPGAGRAAETAPVSVPFKIPDGWTLRAIQIYSAAGAGGAGYRIAQKWLAAHQKTAAKAAKGAQQAGRSAKDLPTKAEMDALDIELPFTVADKKKLANSDHIILWDNSGHGSRASWHEPQWERQAEIVKKKLAKAGADPKRIHIYPVKKGEDFMKILGKHEGKKQVYALGHAGPLALYFGDDKVDVAKQAKDLATQKVDMICHYGCSFTDVDEKSLKPLQDNLPDGTRITLYGHRTPSTKKDDDPFDPKNPIVRCEVDKDCATMFVPEKERRAMAARTAKNLIGAADPWGVYKPFTGELDRLAAYKGQKPTRAKPAVSADWLAKINKLANDDWTRLHKSKVKPDPTPPAFQLPNTFTSKKPKAVPTPVKTAPKKPVKDSSSWIPGWVRSLFGD
jgi:hypothetical protein